MTDTATTPDAPAQDEPKPKTLTEDLNDPEFMQRIARSIPETSRMTADRLIQLVLNEFAASQNLRNCTRSSIRGAVRALAQLGLEPGPLGLAYLTPRGRGRGAERVTECQVQVGYKGYLALCRRSGDVKEVVARTVYEGDQWSFYRDETGDHMMHVPVAQADRGESVRWYMHAILRSGSPVIEVLEREDVEKRRAQSEGSDNRFSPWVTHYDAMAKKSCVRSALPWLPLDTEVAANLAYDEMVVEEKAGHLVAAMPGDGGAPDEDPEEAARQLAIAGIRDFVGGIADPAGKAAATQAFTERWGPPKDLTAEDAPEALAWINARVTDDGQWAAEQEDDGTAISPDHLKRLHVLLGRLGITDRDEKIAKVTFMLPQERTQGFSSTKELTDMEAVRIIGELATEVSELDPEQVGPDGEVDEDPEPPAAGEKPGGIQAPTPLPSDATRDDLEGQDDDARFEALFDQYRPAIGVDGVTEENLRAVVKEVYKPNFTDGLVNMALTERGITFKGKSSPVKRRELALAWAVERVTDPAKQLLRPFEEMDQPPTRRDLQ